MRHLAATIFMFVALLPSTLFAVGNDELSPEAKEIANELRCPTCTGLSVLDSEAPFSRQIKGLLKEKVESGLGKAEIEKFFTERYGPWILRSPPKTGLNLLAWILPISLLVLGPLLLYVFVWRRNPTDGMGLKTRSESEIIDEMKQQLDGKRRGNR